MKFKNPMNGYIVEVKYSFLWTLLFGPLYFAKHGAWKHFVISFLIMWFGIPWFIYPFYARDIIRDAYLSKGWREIPEFSVAKDLRIS